MISTFIKYFSGRHFLYTAILTIISLQFSSSSLYAQEEEEYSPPTRLFISPDFGLIAGNITSIELSPSVGYHLTNRFAAGIGGKYEYFRQIDPFTRKELVKTDIWGIKLFSRLMIIPSLEDMLPIRFPLGLFGQAELEFLSLENKYYNSTNTLDEGRFWHTALLTGAGISQQTGQKTFINIMILWDLTNSSASPYVNPVIRFGIQIYL